MLLVGLVAISGCASRKPAEPMPPLPPAHQAAALIRPTYARFVFPRETVQEFSWNVPAADASPGTPEFGWEVYWSQPWERLGKDPHAIWAIVYWRPGGARNGTLSALLQGWNPMVMTACGECGTPASTSREDSSVRLQIEDNRVVFTVEGAPAVKRLFPITPDTVIFSRMAGRSGETEDTVLLETEATAVVPR